jgi:hypothetical protein
MKSRSFIPCSEHPLLAALTTEYSNLTAMVETVHELASFSGPVGTIANSLGEETRDTMVAELDWRLPKLRLAESAFQVALERFRAEADCPQCLQRTVKVNTSGAVELLSRTAEVIKEAEQTQRKEGPAADRRIERRYRASLSPLVKVA